mmetsp:Transcript_48276/g.98346  ORF Transcript_48276/g.98346 Transcript_48276/m.98346 type:complete len:222 (+) Transcript_48276:125-790(+)
MPVVHNSSWSPKGARTRGDIDERGLLLPGDRAPGDTLRDLLLGEDCLGERCSPWATLRGAALHGDHWAQTPRRSRSISLRWKNSRCLHVALWRNCLPGRNDQPAWSESGTLSQQLLLLLYQVLMFLQHLRHRVDQFAGLSCALLGGLIKGSIHVRHQLPYHAFSFNHARLHQVIAFSQALFHTVPHQLNAFVHLVGIMLRGCLVFGAFFLQGLFQFVCSRL